MPRSSLPTRRAFALAAGAAALAPGRAFAAIGAPETKKLRVGIPVAGTSFLPVYVAAERTWKDNGLDVELVSFRGDAEVAQALAGGSVDVSCQSLDGIINLIEAGQKVIAFFAGLYFILRRTRVGLIVRAGVENGEMVRVLGSDAEPIDLANKSSGKE